MAIPSIDALGSIAASANTTVEISVPEETQVLFIPVSVQYAAVSATQSGVTVGLQTSVDGTTFVAAAETAAELKPAAGVLGTENVIIRLGDDPYRKDAPSRLNAIKITLSNTDGTNAALYAVSHEAVTHQL